MYYKCISPLSQDKSCGYVYGMKRDKPLVTYSTLWVDWVLLISSDSSMAAIASVLQPLIGVSFQSCRLRPYSLE